MSVGREGVFPIPCSWTLPTVAVCTREENSHAFANRTRRGILLRKTGQRTLWQALEALGPRFSLTLYTTYCKPQPVRELQLTKH